MARRRRFLMTAGERNGRLVAIVFVRRHKTNGQHYWKFRCDCGEAIVARVGSVRSANTASCGCLKLQIATRHNMSKSPEYRAWSAMLDRCSNPKNKSFHNYGGRGIKVSRRWRTFENFYADLGPRPPGLTLERLNNERGYDKQNCKWATWTEQGRNRRKPGRIRRDRSPASSAGRTRRRSRARR